MTPQICHEAPLKLLRFSRTFNDYEYCLVHLLDKYPEYFEFFVESLKMGRRCILDNSIFELGTAFDADKFAEWIIKLQPTEYIVPDALENTNETIEKFKKWKAKYVNLPGKKIGVVQGKNFEELTVCYNFMHQHADKIAISFDYSYYFTIGKGVNPWQKFANGRRECLRWMNECGVLRFDKPMHLLGCALPQELKSDPLYKQFDTVDTSNPIVHGIKGILYTEEGLTEKNPIKIVDLFEESFDCQQLENILFNVDMFRKFVNE